MHPLKSNNHHLRNRAPHFVVPFAQRKHDDWKTMGILENHTADLADHEALCAQAAGLHALGYNCAQCVACTLAPFVGANADTLFRATEALGGGMGGFTETCGALSGGIVVLGLANSNGTADPTSKPATYALARELVDAFRAETDATLCCDIKGAADATPSPKCPDCIARGVRQTATILGRLRA